MTQQQEHAFPYYRSPDDIRRQEFSHRMRGLDEYEVQEFLDLLADQVRATEHERAEFRTENEQLRAEVERLRKQQPEQESGVSPQAVILFSQAQQVADQLVEEAVRHARDLMTSARNQQREILQQAHQAAENAVRVTDTALSDVPALPAAPGAPAAPAAGYSTPMHEIEYVRTFAKVAQVQLRSVLEALTEQVDKLGEMPNPAAAPAEEERGGRRPDVYPRPTGT